MLCGHPSDDDWPRVTMRFTEALLKAGKEARVKEVSHRRGKYVALSEGASMGGGSTVSIGFIMLCRWL
jgi:hypothetical protein